MIEVIPVTIWRFRGKLLKYEKYFRHSGAEPTSPREVARPDDRLHEEPGTHNHRSRLWIPDLPLRGNPE
jgi:hypothetical protein